MEVNHAMDCVFCRIAKGEIPSYKVYEESGALAFLDINPLAKGHTLVMPRRHVEKLGQLKLEEISTLCKALQRVANALEGALQSEGLNIFVNQGEAAGQVIPHLHIHLVPRWSGDGLVFPSRKVEVSEEELRELSERLSKRV